MLDRIVNWFFNNPPDYGVPRNPKWEYIRNQYVMRNPTCKACNTIFNIEVHHIKPFHLYPELELDTTNFISLCRNHHFKVGHFSNWLTFNPNVIAQAKEMLIKHGIFSN